MRRALLGGGSLTDNYLGYRNVRSPRTVSQQGNFSAARRDGNAVRATGPNPVYPLNTMGPVRKLVGPFWENKLFGVVVTAQSRGQGANVGAGGEAVETSDAAADGGIRTWKAPLPGKALMPIGSASPNPDGVSSPAKDTFWPPEVYASLIDAREGVNYMRTAGKEAFRETPGMAAIIQFAMALPDSSKVVLLNGSLGSCEFSEVWGAQRLISGWSWDANGGDGRLTFTIIGDHSVQVGEKNFVVAGTNPSGGSGTFEVTAVNPTPPASTVTVKMASDPGPWVSGGSFTNRAPSLQSLYSACTKIAVDIAPAMGLTFEVYAVLEMGHESDSTDYLFSQFFAKASMLRSEADALQAAVAPESEWQPWIVSIGVDWPRNNWTDRENKIGEGSYWTYGWVKVVRENLIPKVAHVPTHWAQSGLGLPLGSPHNGSYGSQRFGALFGDVLVDIGLDVYSLPGILTARRTVGSPDITFTLNGASVKDTTEVWDDHQQCGGVQLFVGDKDEYSNQTEGTRLLTEVAMASVANDGTSAVAGDAIDPRRNFIGPGFKMALQTATWCGREIVDAEYDEEAGTVALTLDGEHDHNLQVDADIRIFHVFEAPLDGILEVTLVDGTEGNVLVYATDTDPGAFAPNEDGAFVIESGNFCVGNHYGNRCCYRAVVDGLPSHSYVDGAPLYRYWPIDLIRLLVTPPSGALLDAETAIQTEMQSVTSPVRVLPLMKWSFDPANGLCIASGNAGLTNLGSTGTTENYQNGLSAGSDSRDFAHSGVYDSKKRTGYLYANTGTTCLMTPVTPGNITTLANVHKAWSGGSPNNGVCWGVAMGRYVTDGNPQYIWSTMAGEGGVQGPGGQLRFATNVPQLIIRGAAGSTVWFLNTTTALATGDYYVLAWFFRNGGASWLYCNGEIVRDSTTPFTSPSSSAAQNAAPLIGGNTIESGTSANQRRFKAGHEFHGLELNDEWPGFDLEFGDLEPYANGAELRMAGGY